MSFLQGVNEKMNNWAVKIHENAAPTLAQNDTDNKLAKLAKEIFAMIENFVTLVVTAALKGPVILGAKLCEGVSSVWNKACSYFPKEKEA